LELFYELVAGKKWKPDPRATEKTAITDYPRTDGNGVRTSIQLQLYDNDLEYQKRDIVKILGNADKDPLDKDRKEFLLKIMSIIDVGLAWKDDDVGALTAYAVDRLPDLHGLYDLPICFRDTLGVDHTATGWSTDGMFVRDVQRLMKQKETLLRLHLVEGGAHSDPKLSTNSLGRTLLCHPDYRDSLRIHEAPSDLLHRFKSATYEEMMKLARKIGVKDVDAFEEKARLCCLEPLEDPEQLVYRYTIDYRHHHRLQASEEWSRCDAKRNAVLPSTIESDTFVEHLASMDKDVRGWVF